RHDHLGGRVLGRLLHRSRAPGETKQHEKSSEFAHGPILGKKEEMAKPDMIPDPVTEPGMGHPYLIRPYRIGFFRKPAGPMTHSPRSQTPVWERTPWKLRRSQPMPLNASRVATAASAARPRVLPIGLRMGRSQSCRLERSAPPITVSERP